MKTSNFIKAFASAVKQGIIHEPFCTKDVMQFAEMTKANVSDSYKRVMLPNGAAQDHSPTYPKYFEHTESAGWYILSDLGRREA